MFPGRENGFLQASRIDSSGYFDTIIVANEPVYKSLFLKGAFFFFFTFELSGLQKIEVTNCHFFPLTFFKIKFLNEFSLCLSWGEKLFKFPSYSPKICFLSTIQINTLQISIPVFVQHPHKIVFHIWLVSPMLRSCEERRICQYLFKNTK